MHLTSDEIQIVRLLCDLALQELPEPEHSEVIALLAKIESFLKD